MKEEIYTLIRNSPELRKKIANYLNVTDSTVYGHAVRQAPKLLDYGVVRIIMLFANKTEIEIFDNSVLIQMK